MRTRGSETVTLVRLGPPDRFGDAVETQSFEIPGCMVLPSNTEIEMQTFQEDVVTSDLTVIMPKGTDVRLADKLVVRGTTYDVEGNPFELRSPITGRTAGIQVRLGAISG